MPRNDGEWFQDRHPSQRERRTEHSGKEGIGERVEILLKSSVQRAMDMTVEAFLWMEVLGPLIETFYDMRDPI